MVQNFFSFNPASIMQQNTAVTAVADSVIYKCNPKNATSDDGHYRAIIKVIYNPFNFLDSIVEKQSYSMNDENGWFNVVSSLTNGDKSCPIFSAWKSLRYSKDPVKESWASSKAKGGKGWFDKRTERYVTIQVIEDKNQPELEGRYMLWKLPKFIQTLIESKQSPSPESGKPSIPVMDLLLGRAVELEVTPGPDDKNDPSRKNREISYELSALTEEHVQCTMPDGAPLITDEQQEVVDRVIALLKKAWKERDAVKRAELMATFAASDDVKAFNEFYGNEVLKKVQDFCPNVKEEMSYKPWSEETAARVNAWIAKVMNGIDPEIPQYGAPAAQPATVAPQAPAAPDVSADADSAYNDDDLPF